MINISGKEKDNLINLLNPSSQHGRNIVLFDEISFPDTVDNPFPCFPLCSAAGLWDTHE